MREDLIAKTNDVYEHLLDRLEHEIKTAPLEALEHVVPAVLQVMDFKNAMQQAEGNQMAQDSLMRSVKRKIDRGEFGMGFGQMPGFPPTGPPPS